MSHYIIQKQGKSGSWKKYRGKRSSFKKAKTAHARLAGLRYKGVGNVRVIRIIRVKTRRSR